MISLLSRLRAPVDQASRLRMGEVERRNFRFRTVAQTKIREAGQTRKFLLSAHHRITDGFVGIVIVWKSG